MVNANNLLPNSDESSYEKLVEVSIYFCMWILSCVLVGTYLYKRKSNLEYNNMITKLNTKRLSDQIKIYNEKCKAYSQIVFSTQTMDETNDANLTGVSKVKRDMYTELLKTIEMYDKCNYIKLNAESAPFPFTEITISSMLLLLVVGIIVMSNLSNNPFQKVQVSDKVKEIQGIITSTLSTQSKQTAQSFAPTSGGGGGGLLFGGASDEANILTLQNKQLDNLYMNIASRINFLKADATFNYVSISFSIVIFTLYIAYSMLMSSFRFKDTLYTGRFFITSKCYK
jgi:hypothetical protein